jgi:predicted ATPase
MFDGGPPSGVVTFLFTDVEGSTRRWEDDAHAMRAALAAHDEVLRSAIGAHGGYLFKHTGDGICAAFASPRSAVDAAVAAQRGLGLPVRMGIATGEAELRDGDYFGPVLNRAARVMAAGHGGQILLVESTASLVSGVDLLDLGSHRLRDVPVPVRVFQVRAEGLGLDFPPLHALDVSTGNLRAPSTTLIGRDSELADIQAAARSHRVVTLTGVGGVGKTRLALEVARHLAGEFPDGVWLFELAAVADPAAVPDAVAAVLGITQQPGKSASDSVSAALEGRLRLLVFDNCEHVLDAVADLIEAILDHSTTVRVLATSREGLSVAEEQVWPVRSLGADAATRLFLERAHSVAPEFSDEDSEAIAEICRRLDGIPLAIELAASRTSSMAPSDIRDRLDHRFKLLVGTRRGLERHQTLRQAVQWSYDLLDDSEKAVLTRCSVFTGGFDVQSACAVSGLDTTDDFELLDLLDALVRKSLVASDLSSGRVRFSMLETIRQFAEEQLVARGEADEIRTAHARHFAGRESDILTLWDSPRQREAYAWFAAELANLRTAFRWAAHTGDLDTAAPIATYAALLGILVDNYETIAWAEELIEPAGAVDHPRLAALYAMATQCLYLGRVEECRRYSEDGQQVFLRGQQTVPTGFETWLGTMAMNIDGPDRPIEWCRRLLARGSDPYALAAGGLVLGLMRAGSHAESRAAATDLAERTDHIPNPWARSFALLIQGMAYCDADDDRSRAALCRGLVLARDSGNRAAETNLASILGRLEARHGDPLTALENLTVAIRNYHDSGNTSVIHVPLAVLTALLHRLGHYEAAATITGYALSPVTKGWIPELRTAIAELRASLGDQAYESLAHTGATMSGAAVVAFAYAQIDRARAELHAGDT